MNKWYVYVLASLKNGRHYIGYTSNPNKRLEYHNKGANRSTRQYRPYKIIYLEAYDSKHDALKREKKIKSYKSGDAFKKLVNS